MSLNIKNDERCSFVRELSRRTGTSLTGAITIAVKAELERYKTTSKSERAKWLDELSRETAAMMNDGRTSKELMDELYDPGNRSACMIVDTSALIAILKGEPEAAAFKAALLGSTSVKLSAATYFEACIITDGYRNPLLAARFEEILEGTGIVIEPVTAEQARIAREAYRNYGKGSGHRAQLNFGDCFSYALARVKREPLLFKGDDFIHTDVRSALS